MPCSSQQYSTPPRLPAQERSGKERDKLRLIAMIIGGKSLIDIQQEIIAVPGRILGNEVIVPLQCLAPLRPAHVNAIDSGDMPIGKAKVGPAVVAGRREGAGGTHNQLPKKKNNTVGDLSCQMSVVVRGTR